MRRKYQRDEEIKEGKKLREKDFRKEKMTRQKKN